MGLVAPSWYEVISTIAENTVGGAAFATPGVVVSYSASSRTATIRPGVNRLVPAADDEDEDLSEELPALQNVPVCWLIGRGIEVKATLQAGDPVLLLACDRDISAWRRTGAVADPDDARTHDWANAIAIPGLIPDTNPFTNTDAAALASKTYDEINKLRTSFNALVNVFTSHTHLVKALPDPAPGPPTLATVTPSAAGVAAAAVLPVDSAILKLSS